MKKIPLLFLILALSLGFIKLARAEEPDLSNIQFAQTSAPVATVTSETPVVPADPAVPTQVVTDLGLVVLNTASHQITADQAAAGFKFRDFNNQFVFQVDKDTFNADATLEVKELFVGTGSIVKAPDGWQFGSRIFEYNLITDPSVKIEQPLWFSVKYGSDNYYRKTMYYYDEVNNKWVGIEALVNNGSSKLVSKINFTHAKVAILEDFNIMTDGTASWYKYKGCNCAASPDYPKGTKLKVTNIDNGKSVVVKVNDWGPDRSIHPTRVIDLDVVAFKQIAKKSSGLCKVKVELYQPQVAVNK